MKIRTAVATLTILLAGTALRAQIAGDVLGMHNFGPGSSSPITGARPDSCSYCHAPHSGLNMGLWNQRLTTQVYTTYTSDTEKNTARQPTVGRSTNHCLSCHDGSVAVGTTVAYGQVTMKGSMNSADVFGTNMQSSHPFSLVTPLKDNIDMAASLTTTHKTADPTGAVRLAGGNVECVSCHTPHVQARDLVAMNFLVRDSSNGQLCLACHDPARQVSGQINPLADWSTSAHALATSNKIASQANLGSYATVAADACNGCHAPHNGGGPVRLLRGKDELDCLSCHSGGANISPMPAYDNVASEYATPRIGHPFPSGNNTHDPTEAILLNSNRHATCVDCHSPHGSQMVKTFPPAPLIRVSQMDIAGISATDGATVLTPAVNQYENCLRCHGNSTGKATSVAFGYYPLRAVSAGDPLNVLAEFGPLAPSSHPVVEPVGSGSAKPLSQPSLLANMLNLDGVTQGRAMGTQILCTDCHNSDDNRESGGAGPNGPHGSKWQHILEREYEYTRANVPGGTAYNLYPTPDLTQTGPYAMCAKCHDLKNQIMLDNSFTKHSVHIKAGFSCSACHVAHGMGNTSTSISGERLVNFDLNVVAQNGSTAVSYSRTNNTCALVCHQYEHDPDGTVKPVSAPAGGRKK
ncbi:MAG: cytochrome c3 family protein [Terracidiphilus sp.]